jgi:hypothetical protein
LWKEFQNSFSQEEEWKEPVIAATKKNPSTKNIFR